MIASILFTKSSLQEAFPRCKILQNVCKYKFLVGYLTKLSDFLVVRGKNRGGIQIFLEFFKSFVYFLVYGILDRSFCVFFELIVLFIQLIFSLVC